MLFLVFSFVPLLLLMFIFNFWLYIILLELCYLAISLLFIGHRKDCVRCFHYTWTLVLLIYEIPPILHQAYYFYDNYLLFVTFFILIRDIIVYNKLMAIVKDYMENDRMHLD